MKRSKLVFALCVLSFVIASGCNSTKKDVPAPASQAQPAANAAQAEPTLSGKVVETMNSGGYTYVSLENNGKKMWVAIPAAAVKVGQEVTCQPGMEMKNFTSKTLNRTFESIIFSGGLR
jgi:predicted small secreted protein